MDDPMGEGAAIRSDLESAVLEEDKLELRVWLRLLTCTTLIDQRVRSRFRTDFDFTLPRFDVLAQLDRAPEGLTMGELSDRLMVSNGNITGLIDRLMQEKLVSRAPSPRDRRTQLVRLTPGGKESFDAMTPAHESWVVGMMAGLSRKDMALLLRMLSGLKESLREAKQRGRR